MGSVIYGSIRRSDQARSWAGEYPTFAKQWYSGIFVKLGLTINSVYVSNIYILGFQVSQPTCNFLTDGIAYYAKPIQMC